MFTETAVSFGLSTGVHHKKVYSLSLSLSPSKTELVLKVSDVEPLKLNGVELSVFKIIFHI